MCRANFSIYITKESCAFFFGYGRVECASYLVEPRADVGAYDKLDALDFCLDEHDTRVLCLGRVRVPA
jgi:hypothetical protein